MRRKMIQLFIPGLLLALPSLANEAELKASVRARSESALLEESTAAKQAAAQAKSRSEYGLELRPRVTDSDAGVGLRIYLPDRWSKKKLREQLVLVAQSEQLRVAALEWQELLAAYRDFCTYRMLRKQLTLHAAELEILEPYLAQADLSVQQHQLAVADRVKLYSLYLDLLNDREKNEMEFIGIQRRLHLALGSKADLETFSKTATIEIPGRLEIGELVRQALGNRADYRRLDVEVRALGAAEAVARSEDGFRFKYIQPEYSVDFDGDREQTWGVSAAFVLPWGTRNPEIGAYQQQRMLVVSSMEQQRRIMEERLQVLLNASVALKEQIERRSHLVLPLVEQLETDLEQMDNLPLEQLLDLMSTRERILDAALQTAKAECERERIAVDLAEELGTLGE
ncbi:MAG: hypothetical protein K9M45_05880 [Kiritimatiellales bacterium]|nr:hypothetical protein [Kiritimatiellales bacterium]